MLINKDASTNLQISKSKSCTPYESEEHSTETPFIIAQTMFYFNQTMIGMDEEQTFLIQVYSPKQSLTKFKKKQKKMFTRILKQHNVWMVFEPVQIEDLTTTTKSNKQSKVSFFYTEKRWHHQRDDTIKTCTYANGSIERSYKPKYNATSPTAATEAIVITEIIKAKLGCNILTLDVPNAFI